MRLDPGTLSAELEFDLDALPNVETLNIDIEKFPKGDPPIDVAVPRITPAIPGQILLKDRQTNGFMWVQLTAQPRSKMGIRANVVMRNAQGQVMTVNRANVLQGTMAQFQRMRTIAAAKVAQVGKGNSQAQKDAASALSKAEEAVTTMEYYQKSLQRLATDPIRIRVSADFDGYQVLLAQSDPELDADGKAK